MNKPTALAIREPDRPTAIVPRTVEETTTIAASFAKSQLIPAEMRQKQGDVFFTIMYGLELGLPPASSMRAISIVKGKPFVAADACHALCLRHPACEYMRRKTDECVKGKKCVFVAKRKGEPEEKFEFTIEDAQRQGLIKQGGNWEKIPDRMMEARCKTGIGRLVFPEVMSGVYCPEEADSFDDAPIAHVTNFAAPPPAVEPEPVVIDAEVVDEETGVVTERSEEEAEFVELLADIAACSTNDELNAVRPKCAALKEKNADMGKELLSAYTEKKRELSKPEGRS